MDPVFTSVATSALMEGVKFLYQQAGEFLSAWRTRRRDKSAKPPRALPSPERVLVANARPLADPTDDDMLDLLQELKDLVEPIKDGSVPVDSDAAREAIAALREILEAALQAPITFAGEPPRTARVADVEVVTQRVSGKVTGLRAGLEQLARGIDVRRVRVQAGDVEAGGEVSGVDLR